MSHFVYNTESAEYVDVTAYQRNANAVLCFALASTSAPIASLRILGMLRRQERYEWTETSHARTLDSSLRSLRTPVPLSKLCLVHWAALG